MKFAIVARPDNAEAISLAKSISEFLSGRGHETVMEKNTANAAGISKAAISDISELSADIAVVIGGDGTVLHTVRQLRKQIPIVGINRGHVGFLTELDPDEAKSYIEKIEEGRYFIEERMRLHVLVDGEYAGDALNEAVIATSRPAKILHFIINIDGVPAERFRADGIIVSTPTGSTGYAMSAGGPIVDPWTDNFLIIPLAPYYLSSRPHVVSSRRSLIVEFDSPNPADLVLDGQHITELSNGSEISFEKSPEPALFVNLGKNFFAKVDNKLKNL
ncbi:MAG: NAD(+)/NADH kinase [Methanomicrobium sp.]|nr:NAD(+)/NADH kinase [Methanomicrobium sp.]